MSTTKRTAQPVPPPTDQAPRIGEPLDQEADRYDAVGQYSLGQIFGLWAAAVVPMSLLAWVVAPWLADRLGGPEPLAGALLICFNAGLIWILVLTLVVVRREQGSLDWPRVRDALWLRSPQDPKTRRVGGRVWWWVLAFALLAAALEALPINPEGPLPRDLRNFISTASAQHFFHGAWGWFALTVMVCLLAPIVEELFFRGLLLPRMRAVFGSRDWVANGAMFTAYHLHEAWVMPTTLLTGVFTQAYPAKRFRSIWISLITHTLPSFLIIGVVLALVL